MYDTQIDRLFEDKKSQSGANFSALVEKYSKIKPGLA